MSRAPEATDGHGPDGTPALSPYLIADDAHALVTFLQRAFGAHLLQCDADAEGRVRHAALRIADGVVMASSSSEAWPAMRTMLHLYVPDVDEAYATAVAAGGNPLEEPSDRPYGDRTGAVFDPAGNQWWLATRIEPRKPGEAGPARDAG